MGHPSRKEASFLCFSRRGYFQVVSCGIMCTCYLPWLGNKHHWILLAERNLGLHINRLSGDEAQPPFLCYGGQHQNSFHPGKRLPNTLPTDRAEGVVGEARADARILG